MYHGDNDNNRSKNSCQAICIRVIPLVEVYATREWLKDLRKEEGYTQADLEDEIGIDRAYISQIENGKRGLTPSTIALLSSALNKSPKELLILEMTSGYEHPPGPRTDIDQFKSQLLDESQSDTKKLRMYFKSLEDFSSYLKKLKPFALHGDKEVKDMYNEFESKILEAINEVKSKNPNLFQTQESQEEKE
jgi:transcriptional regulator with XRE-family HTH domain